MDRRLFRGKRRDNGLWIAGNVIVDLYIKEENGIQRMVWEDTISQCTGKRDVNNQLIFEGDIVRYNGDKYTVVWLDSMAAFAYKSVTMELRMDTFTPEIVGNIYN